MRSLLFVLAVIPAMASAQTEADFERAMGKFVQFYNYGQADSIFNMSYWWNHYKINDNEDALLFKEGIEHARKSNGAIQNYKYLGIEQTRDTDTLLSKTAVFKVACSGATLVVALEVNKENELRSYRFGTSSPEIEKMLIEAK